MKFKNALSTYHTSLKNLRHTTQDDTISRVFHICTNKCFLHTRCIFASHQCA